jgi:hypothetical protein
MNINILIMSSLFPEIEENCGVYTCTSTLENVYIWYILPNTILQKIYDASKISCSDALDYIFSPLKKW